MDDSIGTAATHTNADWAQRPLPDGLAWRTAEDVTSLVRADCRRLYLGNLVLGVFDGGGRVQDDSVPNDEPVETLPDGRCGRWQRWSGV